MLTSLRLTLGLLLALLFLALLGGFLPQMSPQMTRPSSEYGEWLGQVASRWGPTAERLDALGLLSLFQGRLLAVILAAVGAVALLRLLCLWVPSWAGAPGGSCISYQLSLPEDGEAGWRRVLGALATAGQRIVRRVERDGVLYAVTRRAGLVSWLPGLGYLGILLLLLAILVGWRYGWTGPRVDLALGEAGLLDRSTGLAARLDEVKLVPGPGGSLRRFESRLTLLRGAEAERTVSVGLDRRAEHAGLAVYQLGFGPAVRISAQDAGGRSLNIQQGRAGGTVGRVLRVRFSGRQQEQLFILPDADLVVRLVHYASLPRQGIPGQAFHAQLLRGRDGEVLQEQFVAASARLEAEGIGVDIAPEYYVTLRAEREPEAPLAALGGALLLLGLLSTIIWPPREVWVSLSAAGSGSLGELTVLRREDGAAWLDRVRQQLSEEGHD